MILTTLAAITISSGCMTCSDDVQIAPYDYLLNDTERDRIWREIHFAYKKMHSELKEAEEEAWDILDIDVNEAVCGAMEGAVLGLAGKTVASVVLGAALGAISKIASSGCFHAQMALYHLKNANEYALCAEALQEKLWMDE